MPNLDWLVQFLLILSPMTELFLNVKTSYFRKGVLVFMIFMFVNQAQAVESYSRRKVLRCGALLGASTAILVSAGAVADTVVVELSSDGATSPLTTSREQKSRRGLLFGIGQNQESRPMYVTTLTEAQLVAIGKSILHRLFPEGSIGNASATTPAAVARAQTHQIETILNGSISMPFLEELMFRYFPGQVFGHSWTVGLVAATAFAAAHNVTDVGFNTEKIPLPQFIGGVFYWYLMRTKGIDHSIVAHMGNNISIYIYSYLSYKFPLSSSGAIDNSVESAGDNKP